MDTLCAFYIAVTQTETLERRLSNTTFSNSHGFLQNSNIQKFGNHFLRGQVMVLKVFNGCILEYLSLLVPLKKRENLWNLLSAL